MNDMIVVGPDPALARAVSGDLEEIFQTTAVAASPTGRGRVRSIAAGGPRERRPARIGALAATALLGLALGVAIARPGQDMPRVQARSAEAQPVRLARIDVPPVTPPPTIVPPAQAPPKLTPAVIETSKPAVAKPKARKVKATRAAGSYRCNGLTRAEEARCAHPQVMAADRTLRAAYSRAVRAGVERSTLVSYRSRWASLRRKADDQPAKVIYGYRDMARDLDRLSRGARA